MRSLVFFLICLASAIHGHRMRFAPRQSVTRAWNLVRPPITQLPRSRAALMSLSHEPKHFESKAESLIDSTLEVLQAGSLQSDEIHAAADFLSDNYFDQKLNMLQRFTLSKYLAVSLAVLIVDRSFSLILAKDDGELVGQAWLHGMVHKSTADSISGLEKADDGELNEEDTVAFVSNLAVRKDKRSKGLARNLMIALEKQAAASGFTEVHLKVDSKNIPACKLYESMGYDVLREDASEFALEPSTFFWKTETPVNLHMKKAIQPSGGIAQERTDGGD